MTDGPDAPDARVARRDGPISVHEPYAPATARYLCFADAVREFAAGTQTPRAYLERCIEAIERREPEVKAFVTLDLEGARAAADAATARWAAGRPLSPVDGLPVAIKDLFETADLPTQMNSPVYEGWQAPKDAAHVQALRRGGAAILGKTVTTEFGMAAPGPTRNPWDIRRTPGGSSSGSAASVAAGMVPVASGSQVRGSIVRPASICGIVGFKPTWGALNGGGEHPNAPSIGHLGLLAGTLTDAWSVAHFISLEAGGEPGHPGLFGEAEPPAPRKPRRLARQYTHGWSLTDDASKAAFEGLLGRLRDAGVEIVEPSTDEAFRDYEAETTAVKEFQFDIMAWEMRWPMLGYRDRVQDKLGPNVLGPLERSATMTREDYRRALERAQRFRAIHRRFEGEVDGFVTLGHIGPGQMGSPPVGTPWYNDASSVVGAPSLNLPLLAVEEVPLGVQLMGFHDRDRDLVAIARWIWQSVLPTAEDRQ